MGDAEDLFQRKTPPPKKNVSRFHDLFFYQVHQVSDFTTVFFGGNSPSFQNLFFFLGGDFFADCTIVNHFSQHHLLESIFGSLFSFCIQLPAFLHPRNTGDLMEIQGFPRDIFAEVATPLAKIQENNSGSMDNITCLAVFL